MHPRQRTSILAAACVVLAVLAPSATAAGDGEGLPPPRIIGGTKAEAGEYPFVAAVVDRQNPDAWLGLRCGATIVAPQWVLTSATCLDGEPATHFDVVTARRDLTSSDGLRIPVAAVVVHPGAGPVNAPDAALLMLTQPLPLEPVALPAPGSSTAPGTPVSLVGWGDTATPDRYPSTLMEVTAPIVGDDMCEQTFGTAYDSGSMLCTGDLEAGGIGACDADEGGPVLVARGGGWVLTGVSSWSLGCGLAGLPAVATEVVPLLGWIHTTTGREVLSCAGRTPTIVGTESVDFITGTNGDDVIVTLGGRDVIDALGGDDVICAGPGRDRVRGGAGADLVFGEAGNDTLLGGSGNDVLDGGVGDDLLGGHSGDDLLEGGDGADVLRGNRGRDRLHGGDGDDYLAGGSLRDHLYGGDGRDHLRGGSGHDRLYGGPGDDRLLGGGGRDRVNGSGGTDFCEGEVLRRCEGGD